MDLRLLGPVQAWHRARPVDLGLRRQRFLLAVLALEANRVVPVARLIDLSWPDGAPRSARPSIQSHVHRLRAALAEVPAHEVDIVTEGCGYLLRIDPARIDAHRFRAFVTSARTAPDDAARVALLDDALRLWRGPALSGAAEEGVRRRLCRGLEEAQSTAIEDRAEAQLRLGQHRALLDELTELVHAYPLRERLAGHLMVAFRRAGRAADALHTYHAIRQRLADELGLDPGAELQGLHRAILRGE